MSEKTHFLNAKGEKMKENSKLGVNSSENSKENSANLANSAKGVNLKANSSENSKPNSSQNSNSGSNFSSNLKAIFALPKWAKIFLAVLTIIAAMGLGAAFSLKIWAADKVDSGEIVLKGFAKGEQTRILKAENVAEQEIKAFLDGAQNSVAPSKFAYQSRLYFARLDFLLRSKVIAYIDIQGISWAEGVDKNAVSDISSHNRWVKFTTTQDLLSQNFNEKNLGKVEYKMDFSPFVKTILKYYFAILFGFLFACLLLKIAIATWNLVPSKSTATTNDKNSATSPNLKPLTRKNYAFLGFAFALCAGICAFTFWLGFPGYIWDSDIFSALRLNKNNWHPVFTPYVLEALYAVFGKHSYYLFLANCLTLYLGLFFLIAGFYLRYRSAFSLAPLAIALIGNITLGNFIAMSYILMANFIFCAYGVIFFIIFARECLGKKMIKALWVFAFICLFFGILWRHNAIFSVFPAFFIICYLFLENRGFNKKAFAKFYVKFMILSAVLCLAIVIGVPKALTKGESNPQYPLYLTQIVGMCPKNDTSCNTHERAQKSYEGKKLARVWMKFIVKYPRSFLAHEAQFFKEMWFQTPYDDNFKNGALSYIRNPQNIQHEPVEWGKETLKNFPKNEWQITFSPLQEKIYTAMYEYLPILPHIVFVAVGFFGLLFSAMVWAFRFSGLQSRLKELLLFAFSTGLTAFASALIIAGMATITWSRYMFPAVIFGVMALVGFVAFVLECRCARRPHANRLSIER